MPETSAYGYSKGATTESRPPIRGNSDPDGKTTDRKNLFEKGEDHIPAKDRLPAYARGQAMIISNLHRLQTPRNAHN